MANNSAWVFLWLLLCVSARQIPDRDYHRGYSEEESSSKQQQHHLQSPRHGEGQRLQEENDGNDSLRSNEISDEYPIVTPKRAALLLDRIMVALHHALEDSEDGKGRKINDVYRDGHYFGTGSAAASPKSRERPAKEKPHHLGSASGVKPKAKTPSVADYAYYELDDEIEGRSLDKMEPRDNNNTMDLQRRGHDVSSVSGGSGAGKGHVYWRCYFNAVTCF